MYTFILISKTDFHILGEHNMTEWIGDTKGQHLGHFTLGNLFRVNEILHS